MKEYKTFKEFYPYYLKEHSSKTNRLLHFIGTTGIFILLLLAIFIKWTYALYIPLLGYGFAWVGHFFVEKNKPATFKYPLFSLRGDFKMYFDWLSGNLGKKLENLD